ncbi:MAG: hypothetical protein RLN82_10350 [Pseudomonadales bacterium]
MADIDLKQLEDAIAREVSARDQYRLQKILARIKQRLSQKKPVSR